MASPNDPLPRVSPFPNIPRDVVSTLSAVLYPLRCRCPAITIGLPIVAFISVLCFAGCKPSKPSEQAVDSSVGSSVVPIKTLDEMSPSELIEHAHRLRVAGKWSKLEPCLLDAQRRDVIEMIQAIDKLEYANKTLSGALIQHFGRAEAAKFGKPSAASVAGVFSTKLQVVSETIQNEQAVVTIQIAGGVPLEQVPLVRCESHWCIETDPPITGLHKELSLLADAMTDVATLLDDKNMTPEQTFNLLRTRTAPMKRRITRMSQQATP